MLWHWGRGGIPAGGVRKTWGVLNSLVEVALVVKVTAL